MMATEQTQRSVIVALILTVLATAAVFGITDPWGLGLGALFLLSVGIGLVLPRAWALALAIIPWPVAIGLRLLTGLTAFLGDAWWLAWILTAAVGMIGIALGWGVTALRRRGANEERTSAR